MDAEADVPDSEGEDDVDWKDMPKAGVPPCSLMGGKDLDG